MQNLKKFVSKILHPEENDGTEESMIDDSGNNNDQI